MLIWTRPQDVLIAAHHHRRRRGRRPSPCPLLRDHMHYAARAVFHVDEDCHSKRWHAAGIAGAGILRDLEVLAFDAAGGALRAIPIEPGVGLMALSLDLSILCIARGNEVKEFSRPAHTHAHRVEGA